MQSIDTLISASWVVPVEPKNSLLLDHSVAIDNGIILELLPTKLALKKYQAKNSFNLTDHVLLPGFVNAHTHSPLSLMRGIANDLPLMTWLNEHVWPAEKKWMHEQFVIDGTKLAIAEMIKNGTTCFNEHYFFPEIISKTTAETGIRATIGLMVIDFATNWAKNSDEAFSKNRDAYLEFNNNPLLKFTVAPHSPYAVCDENLQRVKNLADEYNLPINMHVHETVDEIKHSLDNYNKRPLKRLHDLELLSERFLSVHLSQINNEDIALIEKTESHAIHCPESNFKLASGICPTQKLLDTGINVALGTDSVVSNNDLDMLSEMRTATFLAKIHNNDPTALPAKMALRMATINGARALHLDNKIGSIVPGKCADLISINMNHLATQPLYDPIAQIVFAAGREQIENVWVNGKRLLANRQLTTLDEQEILQIAKSWSKKIGNC